MEANNENLRAEAVADVASSVTVLSDKSINQRDETGPSDSVNLSTNNDRLIRNSKVREEFTGNSVNHTK